MGEEVGIIGGRKNKKGKKIKRPEIVLSVCYGGAPFRQRDIGVLSDLC